MSTLSVIVKGNRFQAAQALARARIPAVFKSEKFVGSSTGAGETTVLVNGIFLEQIRELYHAHDKYDGGLAGHIMPVGAILFWSELS